MESKPQSKVLTGVPPKGCRRCPRLVEYRKNIKRDHPEWYNGAVAPWGPQDAHLLIIGLAPGLKGAHRTGRVFTGDSAGAFLFNALIEAKFVSGCYDQDNNNSDDLQPLSVRITNAIACVPPENKPQPIELLTCQPFLQKQIKAMPNLKAILCLGTLAHQACLKALEIKQSSMPFSHGAQHSIPGSMLNPNSKDHISLFDSYHCSRYNTQTRRLSASMFMEVLCAIIVHINSSQ